MVFDMLGYPIEIGDEVVYSSTGRLNASDAYLNKGIVKSIVNGKVKAGRMKAYRHSSYFLNTKYMTPLTEIVEAKPELFV